MYAEANVSHHSPHFHAYYQEHVAIYTIAPVELIAGTFPRRQQRLVEAWAELHQAGTLGGLAATARGAQTAAHCTTEVRKQV